MKVKILYYELKEVEFRSKETMINFLKQKLPHEIMRVLEYENGYVYAKHVETFLQNYRK